MSRAKLITLVGALALIWPSVRLGRLVPLSAPASHGVVAIPAQGWRPTNVLAIIDTSPSVDPAAVTYAYDSVNRLVREVTDPGWYTVSYTYDGAGNLTKVERVPKPGATARRDDRNPQLASSSNTVVDNVTMPTRFEYDSNGKRVSATSVPAANSSGWNNSPVTVTFSAADGSAPYSGSFEPDLTKQIHQPVWRSTEPSRRRSANTTS